MIPPERLVEARHAAFFVGYVPGTATGIAILAIVIVAFYIQRHVTRPTVRLAKWADERCREGEGPGLRTYTQIVEIRRLASVFGLLFEKQATCVKELRQLVGETRHNLRNHLTTISSNAQFVRDGRRNPVAAAQKMLSEVSTVTHILDVNAAIVRNYSHILGDPPTDIRLADLVHDCLDQLEARADEKGIALDAEIPPHTVVVTGHRNHLESVIHNLAENAVKYTEVGGDVKLAVLTTPDGVTIRVSDTGIGIADADKLHVFEMGYRAASAQGTPGDGLGLAYVDSVVSFYGGTPEITDNHPRGTVIAIHLPMPVSSSLPISHTSSLPAS